MADHARAIQIDQVTSLPVAIDNLAAMARADGFGAIDRLVQDYRDGVLVQP